MKLRRLLLLGVPIGLLSGCVQRATSSPPTDGHKLPFAHGLQDVLDNGLQATQGTGVSAAVIIPGQGAWCGASGMSDIAASKGISTDMLFDICSVGKTFTAALVLQLVDQGRLGLEDPLYKWLPDYANIDDRITIRQLLNHTSGVFDFVENSAYWEAIFGDPQRSWTPKDTLALVQEPYFPPGKGWRYSSTNYILLGMIIEEATDSTVAAQFRRRFLVPLNLNNTFAAEQESVSGELAHGHFDLDGDGTPNDLALLSRTAMVSSKWMSGSIVSTAEDTARWADALYGGQVLSQESLEQMLTFHRPVPGAPGGPLASGYGLGTGEFSFQGVRIWGHLGDFPGYMAAMLHFPEHSVSMAVLINDNNQACITAIVAGLWYAVKPHLEGIA